ncbi:uncharacterized protein LY89DRAFT_306881 [Mollisia scopiformis]|uniref:Uncharacterized protein n=1 Tax=Mollisia scopiformis TaxID=149040 RepID=A0A194XR73_MOLSC|nr:uncharacterized protein LY89DRAFT_306881 [Mollisia scopiformis]KUJ22651.1 hypothetical protein LY89DRAFT_306881 [Mollisia scopiformis]
MSNASSNVDTNLAAAALAISLVALVAAVGQLLQQYFATADGYRRCHRSVMGDYGRKTRLHFRWRELRFETLYTTPEIFLVGNGAPSRVGQVLLTDSKDSREKSLVHDDGVQHDELLQGDGTDYQKIHPYSNHLIEATPKKPRSTNKRKKIYRGEMASWVPLLNPIHQKSGESLTPEEKFRDPSGFPPSNRRLPAIIFRERSWDFQPPDVVRPLAKTTLSDIAVIARRMGMKWKEFRPSDGILRAEGHSQTITSTTVRSLGIVLQYAYTGQNKRLHLAQFNLRKKFASGSIVQEQEEIYIPTATADRLGCGVLRTESLLGLPDLTISTQAEIVKSLSFLDRTGVSSAALSKMLKEDPEFKFRAADLVALTTPPARCLGSSLVQVPAPSDNTLGITTSSTGRRAFRQCLEEYIVVHRGEVGMPTQRALQICQEIGTHFAAWDHTDEFSKQDEQWVVMRDPKYLDIVQGHLHDLSLMLNEWEQDHTFRYINLLEIHIRMAIFSENGENSAQRVWVTDYKADVDGYFRLLPKIVEEMKTTGFYDRQMIVDAWVTMMLRAFCWGAIHFLVPGERVPIQYYGSQLPVYIG